MTDRDEPRIRQLEILFGFTLEPRQEEAGREFVSLLRHWGRRINLAGPALLEDPYPHLFEAFWACRQGFLQVDCYIDIGSGAGLPGLAFLLFQPSLQGLLLEPRQKKALFLREVARRLQLKASVYEGGFEDFPDWNRGQLATLRGFRPIPELLERLSRECLPWLWFHTGEAPDWPGFRIARQLPLPNTRHRRISLLQPV